jgi:hypothetical protein
MNLSTYETRRTWLPKTGSPLSADPKTASPRRRHDQIEDANGDKQEPHGAVTGLVWLGLVGQFSPETLETLGSYHAQT